MMFFNYTKQASVMEKITSWGCMEYEERVRWLKYAKFAVKAR